jgi:soluble lytic murein transglycosylase-like protein
MIQPAATQQLSSQLSPVARLLASAFLLTPARPVGRWKMKLIRFYDAGKSLLALVGLAALAGLPYVDLPWTAAEAPGPATAVAAGAIRADPVDPRVELEQVLVTEYIARRYRVSEIAIAGFVDAAYRAGARHSVDPLLILAVMAVESRYNPVAKSDMGAKGLMQVIPRFHLEKLADHGGETALLEPEVNILVGAQILREYMKRFRDTETALQQYAGALDEPTAQYSAKVFAEKARLEALRQKARKQQSA